MRTKLLVIGFLSGVSVPVFAGGAMVGNGGDAIVCRDSTGNIESAELLDFYENRTIRGITPDLLSSTNSVDQNFETVMQTLDFVSPERAKRFRVQYQTFFQDTRQLRGQDLSDIPDSDNMSFPHGCKVEQLVIQQVRTFPEDPLYVLNADIWDRLDNVSKAGMFLHEFLYREVLTRYRAAVAAGVCQSSSDGHDICGDINSIGVRYLNGIFTSSRVKGPEQTVIGAQTRVAFFGPIEIPRLHLIYNPFIPRAGNLPAPFIYSKDGFLQSIQAHNENTLETTLLDLKVLMGDAEFDAQLINTKNTEHDAFTLDLSQLDKISPKTLSRVFTYEKMRDGGRSSRHTLKWIASGEDDSLLLSDLIDDRFKTPFKSFGPPEGSQCKFVVEKKIECAEPFTLLQDVAWGTFGGQVIAKGSYFAFSFLTSEDRIIWMVKDTGEKVSFPFENVNVPCEYLQHNSGVPYLSLRGKNTSLYLESNDAVDANPWLGAECGVRTIPDEVRVKLTLYVGASPTEISMRVKEVAYRSLDPQSFGLVSFRTEDVLRLCATSACENTETQKTFQSGEMVPFEVLMKQWGDLFIK